MKYRVKKIYLNDQFWNNELIILTDIPFLNFKLICDIQYKKHWWSRWKTCDSYDRLEDAYRFFLDYQSNHQCILPESFRFPHNRINGKYVWCQLKMGKIETNGPEYNEGKHYYAGYKPKNYARFYYCSYGKSYEDAIGKLWCDLEIQKLISKNGTS